MGYLGNDTTPGTADYFSYMVQLAPKGSYWAVTWAGDVGTDFGKATFSLASLLYQREDRPSGDPQGKIDDHFDETDTALDYVDIVTVDFYNGTPAVAGNVGQVGLIVGGEPGDKLTAFGSGVGTDPLTGIDMIDGGPGWYRLKVRVNGKHASSSDYKLRFRDVALVRQGDYDGL